MKLLVFFVLITLVATLNFPNCKVSYGYLRSCKRFNYNGVDCVPWDVSKCKVVSVKTDHKCPIYKCQVLC